MKVIQKGFELPKVEYYKAHLRIVNAIFPVNITDKEIEILAHFLSLPSEIINGDMFNTFARKKVIETLNLTHGGMSNHIKNMKSKGYLKRDGDNLVIVPALISDTPSQGYNFKISLNEKV